MRNLEHLAIARFLKSSTVRAAALRFAIRTLQRLGYAGAALALEIELSKVRSTAPELNNISYEEDEAFDELDAGFETTVIDLEERY